ncbi:MAG TPA: LytR family transcriptional regulator [Anaerolineae bacterium]|nr:LytR family transcriptional regulator [Anaerolineae bacterium]
MSNQQPATSHQPPAFLIGLLLSAILLSLGSCVVSQGQVLFLNFNMTPVPVFVPPATATPTPSATPLPPPITATENILLLGSDQRPKEKMWRTDTIMVVAIDWTGQRVGVLSIPRDLYVEFPAHLGTRRINTADYWGTVKKYPGGGIKLLQDVISSTLGIPTQHYIRIQMQGFPRIIDAVGGVTVTLPCPLYEFAPDGKDPNKLILWELPAGPQYLDGKTALKYATFRYRTSDFDRARRQQQLLLAVRDKALQLNLLPQLPTLLQALQDTYSTDLSLLDIVRLAGLAMRIRPENVHGRVLNDKVMEAFTSQYGEAVLRIRDEKALREIIDSLFNGPTLRENAQKTARCLPPPKLTPTPTPTATGTPESGG